MHPSSITSSQNKGSLIQNTTINRQHQQNNTNNKKRPTLAQKKAYYDLQLTTRLEFLEAQLNRYANTVLNVDLTQNTNSWSEPDASLITSQDTTTILLLAGEVQRLKAIASLHYLEGKYALASSLNDIDDIIIKEQSIISEIPILTMGTIGLWGERYFTQKDIESNWEMVESLTKQKRQKKNDDNNNSLLSKDKCAEEDNNDCCSFVNRETS